ncbi:MAG TPA: hypothetical protein DDZ51_11505 [Planctomycetaceae bacterium]|nr:hypothetical protein [Planctomycetaceae bacterium]
MQPSRQNLNRWQEVIALKQHQINVIKIPSTAKAVSEIIFRIHRRAQFATRWTLKTEVAVDLRATNCEPRDTLASLKPKRSRLIGGLKKRGARWKARYGTFFGRRGASCGGRVAGGRINGV